MLSTIPTPSSIHSRFIPSPETRWQRADADPQSILIEPRHYEEVPIFNSGVKYEEFRDKNDLLDDDGNEVGTRYWHDVLTENEIDRGITIYSPNDDVRSEYAFTILLDTPLETGLEGHNDAIAQKLMQEFGVTVIVIGPEFSAKNPNFPGALHKLGRIACKSHEISQSSAASDSASLFKYFCDNYTSKYGIKSDVVSLGESRAANLAQARQLYLAQEGISTLYTDITDPCFSVEGLQSAKEVLHTLMWPITQAAGSVAVGAALAKEGDLLKEQGTVPLRLRYQVGAVLGTVPALMNGEEGLFYRRIPKDHAIHSVGFASNPLAHHHVREQNYSEHQNSSFVLLRGGHFGLAYPSVKRHVIERIHALIAELEFTHGNIQNVRWQNVNMKEDGNTYDLLTEKQVS